MKSSTCAEVRRQLPWFVGDDLDAGCAQTVRAHLRDCAACRREAGALQQARKGLVAMGQMEPPAVAEPMFAAMHASIVQQVANMVPVDRAPWWRRLLPVAAAAALFLCGWWLVREPAPLSVFERPAIGTPVDMRGPVRSTPFGRSQVPLRLLGNETGVDGQEDGLGSGLMGRWQLRTLEGVDVPLRPEVPRQGGASPVGRDR